MRMTELLITAVAASAAPAAAAADFVRITDQSSFERAVLGKTLSRPLIRLQVLSAGKITGRGATAPVTGDWQWREGYFCRDLAWGDRDLGYNCQEVALDGARIRFTSDRGAGQSAVFKLR